MIDSLEVWNPCAALDGGAIVDPGLTVLSEQHVDATVVHGIIDIIALAHAPPEVHRAATYTTGSNANDGLAWVVEEMILKPE